MRLFIAIEIPEELKQEIAGIQDRFRKSGADANWTRPEGIHLTLKFLGEVEESRVPAITGALGAVCRGSEPLQLEITGAGAFPNVKVPRVLWLGVHGDIEQLGLLQFSIEDAMAKLGFEREERRFSPHLTLARIKFPKPRGNWRERIDSIGDAKIGGFEVKQLSLMKSELRRDGAVYTEIARVQLQ